MDTEIQTVAARWDSTFNAGDTNALAGFYATDAGVVPAGGKPVNGSNLIGAFFADLQAKGFKDHKIAVNAVKGAGDTVIATGTWQLSGPDATGGTATFGGNWVNVFVREAGDWRIALHTWN